MFTVVITEQAHLDSIHEYDSFLKPFLERSQIAFCRWRPDGQTLMDAVPQLYEKVARHERWRAIVVCDEEGLEQKNPFDLAGYTAPLCTPGLEGQAQLDYLQKRLQAKSEAFHRAATKPLTRLMTWLCQGPMVSDGPARAQDTDPEFAAYVDEFRIKEDLRRKIIDGYVSEIALPGEIICVAKRCWSKPEYDIQNAWSQQEDCQYSRFYDWNLYFDRMRYLVFDILPKNHRNYTFDYIRFLYALMVLAENETPLAALNPNWVYVLDCQNDEQALRQLLESYDGKLAATRENLQHEIRKTENAPKPRLTDRDAELIFCSPMTVNVATPEEFDKSTLYISRSGLGFATDCPKDEDVSWDDGCRKSRSALGKYLKQPRRALKKSTVDLHRLSQADLDAAIRLNEFQLEDVADHVAEEEQKMVLQATCDLYDTDRFTQEMDGQRKLVKKLIATRMTRKRTVILGLVALLCYILGFLPLFITNGTTAKSLTYSAIFLGVGVGTMLLVSLVTLWFLRRPLRVGYSDYNGIMKGIVNEVEGSVADYSRYLSHACNVMRGYSVLNYRSENENPEEQRIRILKKHCYDLERSRQELREVFGAFLPEKANPFDPTVYYDYDFSRPVDYDFPLPYEDNQSRPIEFLQRGNLVQVPVNFIKGLRVRREELYD